MTQHIESVQYIIKTKTTLGKARQIQSCLNRGVIFSTNNSNTTNDQVLIIINDVWQLYCYLLILDLPEAEVPVGAAGRSRGQLHQGDTGKCSVLKCVHG